MIEKRLKESEASEKEANKKVLSLLDEIEALTEENSNLLRVQQMQLTGEQNLDEVVQGFKSRTTTQNDEDAYQLKNTHSEAGRAENQRLVTGGMEIGVSTEGSRLELSSH